MKNKLQPHSQFTSDCSFFVPPPEEGAIAAAQEVSARLLKRHQATIDRAAKQNAEIGKAITEWRTAIAEQVGLDTWQRFIEYSKRQRASNFGTEEFRPTAIDLVRVRAAKKKARERSLELVKAENIDSNIIHKIHATASEKLFKPPEKTEPSIEVLRPELVPTAVREGKTNPWFVKGAPFDGWYWSYYAAKWGGDITGLHKNNNTQTGQFGHYSRYENYDAGDYDGVLLQSVSETGFWYKAAHPGQKQVFIKIKSQRARYDIYLDDEWGWSDSTSNMWSRLHLDVVQVLGMEGQTGWWTEHIEGSPDETWYHLDWIAPGAVFWLSFTAGFPDAWVYVAIGCEDQRDTGINDVSTDQTMDSQYVIEQVSIQD